MKKAIIIALIVIGCQASEGGISDEKRWRLLSAQRDWLAAKQELMEAEAAAMKDCAAIGKVINVQSITCVDAPAQKEKP